MDDSDLEKFDNFVEKLWKKSIKTENVEEKSMPEVKRRGRKPKADKQTV